MRSSTIFVALASLAATAMAADHIPINATTTVLEIPTVTEITTGTETPYGTETVLTESPYPTGNGTINGTTMASYTPTALPGAGSTFGPAGILGFAVAGVAVVAGAAIF